MSNKTVAFFGDFDNLFVSLSNNGRIFAPSEVIGAIINKIEGTIVSAKMYAHWGDPRQNGKPEQAMRDLIVAGFELVECPLVNVGGDKPKSSTDDEMSTGIRRMLQHMNIDVFVIGTGDRDFLRTMQDVRFAGKEVWLICTPLGCSADLRNFVGEEHTIVIEGSIKNGAKPNSNAKHSWSAEEVEAHCQALFCETTDEGIKQVLASLPPQLKEIIFGCFKQANELINKNVGSGRTVSLAHVRNIICTPQRGLRTPDWAVDVNPVNIMNVLVELSKNGVLHKEEIPKPGKPDELTANYTVNKDHPFVVWLRSIENTGLDESDIPDRFAPEHMIGSDETVVVQRDHVLEVPEGMPECAEDIPRFGPDWSYHDLELVARALEIHTNGMLGKQLIREITAIPDKDVDQLAAMLGRDPREHHNVRSDQLHFILKKIKEHERAYTSNQGKIPAMSLGEWPIEDLERVAGCLGIINERHLRGDYIEAIMAIAREDRAKLDNIARELGAIAPHYATLVNLLDFIRIAVTGTPDAVAD